jgi:hypothetical protein
MEHWECELYDVVMLEVVFFDQESALSMHNK